MPVITASFHESTLNSNHFINTINQEIATKFKGADFKDDEVKKKLTSMLLRRAGIAAYQGASRLEGGPFGAVIVDFNTENGIPKVVGFGTNHVVPNNDPSAHAEMTAIRDASERLGKTDLSGLTLLTSCECCPMCLSAATGCKIDKVYFAATRDDAAAVGFSDADQYRLMSEGGIEKHAIRIDANEQQAAEQKLNGHDAVVVVHHNGQDYSYYGDANNNQTDPTNLPTVQAIKAACAGLSEMLSKEKGEAIRIFHLPEDTDIISRNQPHPLSLITADWARIGRVRGDDPSKPDQDSPNKDTTKIRYLRDELEIMPLHKNKNPSEAVDPRKVWDEIKNPTAEHITADLGISHKASFKEWDRLISSNFMPRY